MTKALDWYEWRGAWRLVFRTRSGKTRYASARHNGGRRWIVALFDEKLNRLRDIKITSKKDWTGKLVPEVKTWALRMSGGGKS